MYTSLTAEVANQRHAEFVAAAAEQRLIAQSRATRSRRGAVRQAPAQGRRRRPFARLAGWVGAGQL